MRGVKPLAIVMIMSMLSACAGRNAPSEMADDDRYLKNNPYIEESASAEDGGERANDAGAVDQPEMAERLQGYRDVASSHRAPRHDDARDRHYHREPSPEAQHAAEVALLVTAQVFVCSFVVVVLNGHCDMHVSTGYYY